MASHCRQKMQIQGKVSRDDTEGEGAPPQAELQVLRDSPAQDPHVALPLPNRKNLPLQSLQPLRLLRQHCR